MFEDFRLQELGVGLHVGDDDMQHVVTLSCHRKTLRNRGEPRDVLLEALPVFVRVFGHRDRE